MTELEKIDLLRERLGIGYREAREALEQAGGDVLEALVHYEANTREGLQEEPGSWSDRLVARIRSIMRQGNVTRIKVKKDGRTVAEIPATAGALGILGVLASSELAILAGLGTVAALFNRYTLEVEKRDGQVEEYPLDIEDVDGPVDK